MDINQLVLIAASSGLGPLFTCVGVLIIFNVKVRDWFSKWWYSMDETNRDKKNSKNYVQFVEGPLMILIGLLILLTGLAMLSF